MASFRTIHLSSLALGAALLLAEGAAARDPRDIREGRVIPSEGYADQPYVVVNDDGTWLCVLTTGPGEEGDRRQHVVATLSADRGRSWSPLIDIEPHGPPESSWAMPLKVPGGRVYVFYIFNGEGVRELDGRPIRADMLGYYVFKHSDDGGRTWPGERRRLPVRLTAADRANDFQGAVQLLWGVGKPVAIGSDVYFGFSKIGRWLVSDTEGFFFRSTNILEERDPARIAWEMLPEGDTGLKAPAGPIAEEHNLVALADGSLYAVYRTTEGWLAAASSRDGGRTWKDRQHATYSPGGRRIKNPRGPAIVRRFSNGRFLLSFYNHGGRDFSGRNPLWLSGGVERDGAIHWSEPEVALYDREAAVRIGYPDFIEDGGRFYITETQKSVARLHELDLAMLEGLWRQGEPRQAPRDALLLELERCAAPRLVEMPRLPDLAGGGGFTLELWLELEDLEAGQVLLDGRDAAGDGLVLKTAASGSIELELAGGGAAERWDSDPGLLAGGRLHHLAAIVDGGPRLISFVAGGRLADGGAARPQGWRRFGEALGALGGAARLKVLPAARGEIAMLRIHGRALRTSEVVASFRTGPGAARDGGRGR